MSPTRDLLLHCFADSPHGVAGNQNCSKALSWNITSLARPLDANLLGSLAQLSWEADACGP
jgi:hypothetical protein